MMRRFMLNSYLHDGEESVKQIDSLNKSLGPVAKETGQAPQFLHSGVPAFCRHSAVILEKVEFTIKQGLKEIASVAVTA